MVPWHPLPQPIFSLVEQTPGTVLLHTSRPDDGFLSRLFTSPSRIVEVRNLNELPALFSRIEEAIEHGHLAAGYFTYECGQHFEPRAVLRPHSNSDLLAWFGIYDRCFTFDHRAGKFDKDLLPASLASYSRDRQIPQSPAAITFGLDEVRFTDHIAQIHEWIRAGDVYQLNFTFPLHAHLTQPCSDLYARLALSQPVDYSAFLHTRPGHHILSFSPELFFRVEGKRHITTQPMKGTAPRGRTTSEDRTIAEWLANDPKNRAENVMIVDLIRNDLGRICSFGSVHVEKLFEVTRYPSLWQMTSRITGELVPDVRYEDIFRALFPCGSVTGAPKVRAMQLLAQIEEHPRGVYTGAIGYFSREKTLFNVAIRTLEVKNGTAEGGVGSGIVVDSLPAAEFRECQLKVRFLADSAEPFSLIETMLWDGDFPLLEFHLDRIADSAGYFAFPCDRDAIRTDLRAAVSQFLDDQPRRVRLLLDAEGVTHIECDTLLVSTDSDNPPRVCIATHRTDSANRFFFHKTTHRELYNRAHATARSLGFADVLFLNLRDQVTEAAVHNVFVENSGRWYTPPLDCGVLPGVYRRHLLSSRPNIEEKILTLNDLKAADGVYLCNAVRGLRRVTIDWNASLTLVEN